MNAPNRYELFVLDDGEKAVEVAEDTKIPNAATIVVRKQDHTLANMIRGELLHSPDVQFAGYKVPHPLHPYFEIKVQTVAATGSNPQVTPSEAMTKACEKLIGTVTNLENQFKREFAYRDVTADSQQAGAYGTGTSGAWGGRSNDYLDF